MERPEDVKMASGILERGYDPSSGLASGSGGNTVLRKIDQWDICVSYGGMIALMLVLAGILMGGRHWTGPRLGEPGPLFNRSERRRQRKRRPRSKQKQSQKRQQPIVGVTDKQP